MTNSITHGHDAYLPEERKRHRKSLVRPSLPPVRRQRYPTLVETLRTLGHGPYSHSNVRNLLHLYLESSHDAVNLGPLYKAVTNVFAFSGYDEHDKSLAVDVLGYVLYDSHHVKRSVIAETLDYIAQDGRQPQHVQELARSHLDSHPEELSRKGHGHRNKSRVLRHFSRD